MNTILRHLFHSLTHSHLLPAMQVWGPMTQLVYWSLLEYDHVPVVRQARQGLAVQMTELMLSQWRKHGHICENFSPKRVAADCTGTKMYHWGALGGLISIMEAGKF